MSFIPSKTVFNSNATKCARLPEYQLETKNTVAGSIYLVLSIANLISNGLLIGIIVFNWKDVFRKDFVYRQVLLMCTFSTIYAIINLVMMVPCTYSGCLFYTVGELYFLTSYMEAFEYGFYYAVFFISIDRFLTFYWHRLSAGFRKVSAGVWAWKNKVVPVIPSPSFSLNLIHSC